MFQKRNYAVSKRSIKAKKAGETFYTSSDGLPAYCGQIN